jgi:hypothetical protein
MTRAIRRLRAKLRRSLRSYATLSAVMQLVIALVVDHTASASPRTVMNNPVDGRSVRRVRLSPKSVAASDGAISVSRSTRSDTVPPSATSVKRPSTTSSTDGIAKNAL